MSTKIKILAGNIQGGHKESRLEYGLKMAYKDADEPDIVLATETWSDDTFNIDDKFANYNNGEEAEIGTGQQASIDRKYQHKVKNYNPRLQLIQILNLVNIINLYAPQIGKSDTEKINFKDDIIDLVQEITNDRPIVAVGDYNINKQDLSASYLSDLETAGTLISTDGPTQKFGKELDYAIVFNKNNELTFTTEAKLITIPSSDHNGILFEITSTRSTDQDEVMMEEVYKRIKIPIPTSKTIIEKFRKLVNKRVNTFLHKHKYLNDLLSNASTNLCVCESDTKHRQDLDKIYENFRNIIINTANELKPKKKSKKAKFIPSRHDDFKKLYDDFKSGIYNKATFKRKLRILQQKYNKNYFEKMGKIIKNGKVFFKMVKKKLNTDKSKARIKKMPFQSIMKMYKQIFEPVEFTIKSIFNFRKSYNNVKGKTFELYTDDKIKEAFKSINRNKASRGPQIELWIYADIYPKITLLFNAFTRHGYLPLEFLTAEVTMLKKSNLLADKDHTNYRPIALIESLSKVFEVLVRDKIPWTISQHQYAYQKKVGTLNALKDFQAITNDRLNKNGKCICVFLDMSKAFDKLSIPAIMKQLYPLIKNDEATTRILAFMLTNTMSVFNNKYKIRARCGIRQGSLLSPMLFLQTCNYWIEEVGNETGGEIMVYADDICLISASYEWLQEKLNSFSNFCLENSLLANPKKSGIIIFLDHQHFTFYSQGNKLKRLYLGTEEIKYRTEYKYLGYLISNCNSDKKHLASIFSKFRKKAINLRRYFKKSPDYLMVFLIKSFLLSTLYGLEFSPGLNNYYINRYNYVISIAFGIKTRFIERKFEKFPELRAEKIINKARDRYSKITTRHQCTALGDD